MAYRSGREEITIAIPALIDAATFVRAGVALQRNRERQQGRPGAFFLLKGLIRCGLCGREYHGANRDGHQREYRCAGAVQGLGCKARAARADRIEESIRAHVILGALLHPEALWPQHPEGHAAEPAPSEVEHLERQIRDNAQQTERLCDLYAGGAITESVPAVKAKLETLSAAKSGLHERLERAQKQAARRIDEAARMTAIRNYCRAALSKLLNDPKPGDRVEVLVPQDLAQTPGEAQRRLIGAVVDEILIYADRWDIRGVLPGRVIEGGASHRCRLDL